MAFILDGARGRSVVSDVKRLGGSVGLCVEAEFAGFFEPVDKTTRAGFPRLPIIVWDVVLPHPEIEVDDDVRVIAESGLAANIQVFDYLDVSEGDSCTLLRVRNGRFYDWELLHRGAPHHRELAGSNELITELADTHKAFSATKEFFADRDRVMEAKIRSIMN